eukprot:CAMPEP_0179216184 /NCGR_PEP_ID=MMETSP0797-20121207/3244_1 /TAXON_ID=47934 /ORGANISM="Dinophysis acuminata, Strain DAEP01" /LENGTH=250 /DNA_ID=CAMNT_0020922327 /DNA_START=152 /DNA_END=901 /DNA_ORIENTATION=-
MSPAAQPLYPPPPICGPLLLPAPPPPLPRQAPVGRAIGASLRQARQGAHHFLAEDLLPHPAHAALDAAGLLQEGGVLGGGRGRGRRRRGLLAQERCGRGARTHGLGQQGLADHHGARGLEQGPQRVATSLACRGTRGRVGASGADRHAGLLHAHVRRGKYAAWDESSGGAARKSEMKMARRDAAGTDDTMASANLSCVAPRQGRCVLFVRLVMEILGKNGTVPAVLSRFPSALRRVWPAAGPVEGSVRPA